MSLAISAVEATTEPFHGLVLAFRGRTALTQRQVATRSNASSRSVQAWEAGISYPGTDNLQAFIACFLEAGGLAHGRERAEAEALWSAALAESPRHRPPFDTEWFAELLARHIVAEAKPSGDRQISPTDGLTNDRAPRLRDWGDAPDVLGFFGRADELRVATRWMLDEHCRVVALLGMGGIGKTMLASRVARDVAPAYTRVYWRSVRNAPPLLDWLGGAISFLSDHSLLLPESETARIQQLLDLLRTQPCLLVLDNLEPLLQEGTHCGTYLEGYSGYGTLLRVLAESEHQSCLLITSREAPAELTELGGRVSVRKLEVSGLTVVDAQALLSERHLRGGEREWTSLVERYGGNVLALKVVAESVLQVFGGEIAAFLQQVDCGSFGGIRRLLDAQLERLSPLDSAIRSAAHPA